MWCNSVSLCSPCRWENRGVSSVEERTRVNEGRGGDLVAQIEENKECDSYSIASSM